MFSQLQLLRFLQSVDLNTYFRFRVLKFYFPNQIEKRSLSAFIFTNIKCGHKHWLNIPQRKPFNFVPDVQRNFIHPILDPHAVTEMRDVILVSGYDLVKSKEPFDRINIVDLCLAVGVLCLGNFLGLKVTRESWFNVESNRVFAIDLKTVQLLYRPVGTILLIISALLLWSSLSSVKATFFLSCSHSSIFYSFDSIGDLSAFFCSSLCILSCPKSNESGSSFIILLK